MCVRMFTKTNYSVNQNLKVQILTFEQILLILREAVKKVFGAGVPRNERSRVLGVRGHFFLKKVTDKSKFEIVI